MKSLYYIALKIIYRMLYLKIYKNVLLNKYTLHSLYAMQYLTFYSFPLLEGRRARGVVILPYFNNFFLVDA